MQKNPNPKKIKDLLQSEEGYKLIIDNLMDIIIILDLNGTFLYVSPQIYEISGFKPEEIIGKSGFKIMHPEDVRKAYKTLRGAIKRKKKLSISADEKVYIEFRTLHKNGNYIDVSASGRIANIDGQDRIVAAIHDISDQKRAEFKIRESEAQHRLITENANDMIAILNNKLEYEYVNESAFHKIMGRTKESLIGAEGLRWIHPEDREKCINAFKQGWKIGEASIQARFKDLYDKYHWLEIKGRKIVDQTGEEKILIVSRDISARKEYEQKLKESEEMFRTIAEQAFMGILIVQDGKIEYANSVFLNILEYSSEEIINWSIEDLVKLIHPDDLQFLRAYRTKLHAGDPDVKPYYSYRVFTKSGQLKWIDQFSKPIIYKGKEAELRTIMDITDKKKAEQELVKLNTLKSELLRRTSHELKTPLVSIKGYADLILKVHKDKLDDYVVASLREIKLGCERLESLIQDILKTSELESNSVELKKTDEDLSFLIKLCVKEQKGLINLRNHTINLEIPDKLIINIEPDQIHIVISNLLNNAIKYTPPNGVIDIGSTIEEGFVRVSIRDSGIGITEEERIHLFLQFGKIERYGQGVDVISDGSGLGLYITKRIIELHGGEIWVESEGRNEGSTFYFTLPMNTPSN